MVIYRESYAAFMFDPSFFDRVSRLLMPRTDVCLRQPVQDGLTIYALRVARDPVARDTTGTVSPG